MTVVTKPVITQPPINTQAVQGRSVAFTVAASGTPPLTFQWVWRVAGVVVSNHIVINGPTNSALVLTNLALSANASRITVAVGNAWFSPVISSVAILNVLADTDHDGLPDSWETNRVGSALPMPPTLPATTMAMA